MNTPFLVTGVHDLVRCWGVTSRSAWVVHRWGVSGCWWTRNQRGKLICLMVKNGDESMNLKLSRVGSDMLLYRSSESTEYGAQRGGDMTCKFMAIQSKYIDLAQGSSPSVFSSKVLSAQGLYRCCTSKHLQTSVTWLTSHGRRRCSRGISTVSSPCI